MEEYEAGRNVSEADCNSHIKDEPVFTLHDELQQSPSGVKEESIDIVDFLKEEVNQLEERDEDENILTLDARKRKTADDGRQGKCLKQEESKREEIKHHHEYSSNTSSELKKHKGNRHEGIRYPCDMCEYAATGLSKLKRHKKSKHEGIRYPCDMCDYAAMEESNLKKYNEYQHEGIRYPCDMCEYAVTHLSNLKKAKMRNTED